jgi:uncharacterized protein (TIGR00369 family)
MKRQPIKDMIDQLPVEQIETVERLIRSWQRCQQKEENFLHELLSFQTIMQEPGHYQFQMQGHELLTNRLSILHGGALATFIDASIGTALQYELEQPKPLVTVDLHIQYLSPGEVGLLRSVVKVIKKGYRLMFAEALVTDLKEKPIALATSTFYVK